jgi:hypothetical protein
MVLLGEMAQLEAYFGPFGDSTNLDAMHDLRREYHRLENCFGYTRWNSSVMWVLWNLVSVRLEMVSVLVQDSVTVCTKTYHRLRKSFWTHPMVLLGYEAQLEAHLGPFGDSSNLDAR